MSAQTLATFRPPPGEGSSSSSEYTVTLYVTTLYLAYITSMYLTGPCTVVQQHDRLISSPWALFPLQIYMAPEPTPSVCPTRDTHHVMTKHHSAETNVCKVFRPLTQWIDSKIRTAVDYFVYARLFALYQNISHVFYGELDPKTTP